MEGVPTDNQWLELGHLTKSIRDCIQDYCAVSCRRYGVSSKMYNSFTMLNILFVRVRSKLDDFVSGAYSINQNTIGTAGIPITQIFYGERVTLSNYDNLPFYKRGELPKSLEETHRRELRLMFQNIETLLRLIDRYPYTNLRFQQKKDAKAILTRFKKHVEKTKTLAKL